MWGAWALMALATLLVWPRISGLNSARETNIGVPIDRAEEDLRKHTTGGPDLATLGRDAIDWASINTTSAVRLLKKEVAIGREGARAWAKVSAGLDSISAGKARLAAGDADPLTHSRKAEEHLSHFLNEDLSGGDSRWERLFEWTRAQVAWDLHMLKAQSYFKTGADLALGMNAWDDHHMLDKLDKYVGYDSWNAAIAFLEQAVLGARNASHVLARHAAKYQADDRIVADVARALSLVGVADALRCVLFEMHLQNELTGENNVPLPYMFMYVGEHWEGMEVWHQERGIPLGYGISLDLEMMLRLFNRVCKSRRPCMEFLTDRGVGFPPPPSTVGSRGDIGRRVVHSLHLATEKHRGHRKMSDGWEHVMDASTRAVEYAEAHGFADPGTEARRASAADAMARAMIEEFRKDIRKTRLRFGSLGLWFLAMAACGWWACTRRARGQQSGPRRRGRGGGLRRGSVGGRGGGVGGLWALTRRAAGWAAGLPMSVYWACVGCMQAFAVLSWGGAGWVAGLPLCMYLYARRAWRWVAQLPRAWLAWARLRWCRIARAAAAKVYAIATTIMGAAATILRAAATTLEAAATTLRAAARLLERTTQDAGGGEDSAAAGAASQPQSDDRGPESNKCCVCMDAPRTHAFIPCGHKCVCLGHSEMTKCPICRQVVQGAIQIYD